MHGNYLQTMYALVKFTVKYVQLLSTNYRTVADSFEHDKTRMIAQNIFILLFFCFE